MPAFDYDKLLWGERQIRSVANMTRQDARDFIFLAHDLKFRPRVVTFSLEDANKAFEAVKHETDLSRARLVGGRGDQAARGGAAGRDARARRRRRNHLFDRRRVPSLARPQVPERDLARLRRRHRRLPFVGISQAMAHGA